MAKPRIRTTRNPVTPRKSVISGRGAGGTQGDLIDLGADPIPRYGVVYITQREALAIAEHIGWVDGDLAREKIADLQRENALLRGIAVGLPLLVHTTAEGFKDALTDLATRVAADYDAALSHLPTAPIEELPAFAAGTRAETHDDAGREPATLVRVDGDDPADDHEAVGGQPVPGDGDDHSEPADGDGTPRGDVPAVAADAAGVEGVVVPAGKRTRAVRAAGGRPARITDIAADDDDPPPGD